eukprot:CAMPEP_0176422218 /NCGR_PEP_ID=MMETSP0127-20121128/9613_1 /TAXON_ID=938130 /ORGANISM="Platyophrya macrostoma, Strain WH" /LENGTH=268 /DNA_ID=CAMNT_0017803047 /DNA_START=14 /DNA_END=820 /DNA_ORIENTATION=+
MAKKENPKLVQVAVQFLLNPATEKTPDDTKKAFLKKKGLTDEQIDEAFKLAKERKEKEKATAEKPAESTTSKPAETVDSGNEESVQQLIEKAKKTNVLALRKRNLNQIPAEVFELTNLTTLILSFNPLESIPAEIKNLVNLETLHIANCGLYDNQIHDNLWELSKLRELDISKNKLTRIKNLTKLTGLTRLDASQNELIEMPDDIGKLSNAEILNFRCNNINIIPGSLVDLSKLKLLLIRENNLDDKLEKVIQTKGLPGLKEWLKENY